MTENRIVTYLAGQHTALHVNFDTRRVRDVQSLTLESGGFFVDFSLKQIKNEDELADLLSVQLQFPELTRNWDAIKDWATDLGEFVENEAGYVIVIKDCQFVPWEPEIFNFFFSMWLSGVAAAQFNKRFYHVIFTGDESFGERSIKGAIADKLEVRRRPLKYAMPGDARSDRMPVVDWKDGLPKVVLS